MSENKVILYSLSTCVYCKALKKMLDDLGISHVRIQADELADNDRKAAVEELKKVNPRCSFPTTIIGDTVVSGYKVQEIKDALGIRTEVDNLFDRLKKVNEPKGYMFNCDTEITYELLRSLLTNKDRYGYMACPCRLANGERERDRDIICPCDYREHDIAEFGCCYCGLYVSEDWNNCRIIRKPVPERRSMKL